MIVAEYEEGYGIIPVIVGAAIAAGIGGAGYYLGRKSTEAKYYSCLEEQIKAGASIEEARKACGTPFLKPTLLQQLAFIPIALGIGYILYRSVSTKKTGGY